MSALPFLLSPDRHATLVGLLHLQLPALRPLLERDGDGEIIAIAAGDAAGKPNGLALGKLAASAQLRVGELLSVYAPPESRRMSVGAGLLAASSAAYKTLGQLKLSTSLALPALPPCDAMSGGSLRRRECSRFEQRSIRSGMRHGSDHTESPSISASCRGPS